MNLTTPNFVIIITTRSHALMKNVGACKSMNIQNNANMNKNVIIYSVNLNTLRQKKHSCTYCDFKAKLKDVFDEHTVNHNVEEIETNEDIADQSLDFEKDLDDEKYFDESYPDYYKIYVETNLEGGKYVDCYYCGFCTSHASFVISTEVMKDHISEEHKEELKDFDKVKAWDICEKDFHKMFETDTIVIP